jgi:hypothetical protein
MCVDSKYLPESQSKIKFYDGQSDELIGVVPHKRVAASETELLVWECHCPICSDTFEDPTPSRARTFEPNRRCQKHKRPGVRPNRRMDRSAFQQGVGGQQ